MKQEKGDWILLALAIAGGATLSSIESLSVFALGWVAIILLIFSIKSMRELREEEKNKRIHEHLRQGFWMLSTMEPDSTIESEESRSD